MLDIEQFIQTDELFDGHYRLLRPLSIDGGTADVWLALDVNTIDNYPSYEEEAHAIDESSGMLVAIKIYRPKNALDIEGQQRFRDEFKIAFNCHHTNLLQPTSFNIYKEMPYLVLPYCEAGSAEQFIGKKLSHEMVWKFILDVSSGLERLHSNTPQIIHQDIKPANILIDDNGNFTITDFGISSKKSKSQDNDYYEENNGTLAYMAPERLDGNADAIPESDIWAFGATLYEILTGIVPFGEEGGKAQIGGNTPIPSMSGLPSGIKKLINSCLQRDPNKRPSASEIADLARTKSRSSSIKKPLIITLIALCLAIIVVVSFLLIPDKPDDDITIEYAKVEQLLSASNTATEGLTLLQTLVDQNDYQATFLMSRLYFDNSDYRDTMFFEQKWANMRSYCGIQTDNKKAHDLLMQAFRLNENDYVALFQLGNDFMARDRRGCDRNDSLALWCFNQIGLLLENSKGTAVDRYREAATEKKQRILENPNTIVIPIKP